MTELVVTDVTSGYHYPIPAITDVSLSVRSKQIVTLVGANGAGKTTTLSVISGLMRAWQGSIAIDGVRVDHQKAPSIVQAGVAQVPEGRRILPGLTVGENLAMGGYTLGKRQAKERLVRVLDLFPALVKRLNQLGGTLSGGEQQMLAIGRSLMSAPKILLLDEPSMGLAPQMVERIFAHIVSLRESGLGILLVEQNASLALETSDYAYVMDGGRIVLEGPSMECAANPLVERSYLGV